jgi:arylsulfatase A-like enzyme
MTHTVVDLPVHEARATVVPSFTKIRLDHETTIAGPFEIWPTGLGFEYFHGFPGGEASQYEPNLVRNTTSVLSPKTPEEGYHLAEDLADDSATRRDHRPDR